MVIDCLVMIVQAREGEVLRRPARYRTVPRLPCRQPWEVASTVAGTP